MRQQTLVSFLSQRRELVIKAVAGDICPQPLHHHALEIACDDEAKLKKFIDSEPLRIDDVFGKRHFTCKDWKMGL